MVEVGMVSATLSVVTVDFFMYALASVMFGVLTGICIELLADVSASALAVVMTALDVPMSTPLDEFSR